MKKILRIGRGVKVRGAKVNEICEPLLQTEELDIGITSDKYSDEHLTRKLMAVERMISRRVNSSITPFG